MGAPVRKGDRPPHNMSGAIVAAVEKDMMKQPKISSFIKRPLDYRIETTTHDILWGSTNGTPAQRSLQKKIKSGIADITLSTGIQILAATIPIVGIVYLLYQVAQFVYPIVKQGVTVYLATNDQEQAINAMAREFVVQGFKQLISIASNSITNGMVKKVEEKLPLSKAEDVVVRAFVSETVSAVEG
jgi:hypothetical protein